MADNLEFGWAEQGDLAEVEAYHAARFGPASIQATPGRVRWLYFDNPFGLHVATCRAEGRLVACCGHLPRPVRVGEETLLAGFGVDFMVDPHWRRQGIGQRFLDMRLERFGLSLSTGQSPAMHALYIKRGAVDLGAFQLARHRRRPPGFGPPRAVLRDTVIYLKGLRRGKPAAPELRDIPLQELAGLAGPSGIEQPGLAAWLHWRYAGPVYRDGLCLGLDVGGEPPAGVVLRSEGGVQIVTEILGPEAGRSRMLAAVAHRSACDETRVLFTGSSLTRDLEAAGFWVKPRSARLVAMSADGDLLRRIGLTGLGLTAGAADADLLRFPG